MGGDYTRNMNKLTVVIPAREEKFLQKTIESALSAAVEPIEIIAVMDGYWPDPPIQDHPDVVLIHHTKAIGQRAAINEAMKIATGKYMMKLDAHCSVGEGFDKILKEDCKYEWTMVPRMYNLNALTWERKRRKRTDYMFITSPTCHKPFRAAYYGKYEGMVTPKYKGNGEKIDETMCCMGPCWFMHTDRFWKLGGCDEAHGGWGQQGVEVALKAWLSGGALMVNRKTWFAHWFRGGGVPKGLKKGFPYKMTGGDVARAREYSKAIWLDNKWPKQTRTIEWLVDKFNPPTWNDTTIIYYTDDTIKEPLKSIVLENLNGIGLPVVEMHNEAGERNHLQLFRNIQRGLKQVKTPYVALGEHDCLYPKEHFQFKPPKNDVFYYNTNHYFGVVKHGKYHKPYRERKALSGLVCSTDLLVEAIDKRVKFLENGGEITRGVWGASEFGVRDDDYKSEGFTTNTPYIDIRHGDNFSGFRKGKHRTKSLDFWGDLSKLVGLSSVSDGKWYQEAVINGVAMPTRRKGDTNQKRWETFVEPFVSEGVGRFTDLGCNAGFYCRKMVDLGYMAEGVEREPIFLGHARYWEEQDPKGVRIVEADINDYDIWCSHTVLLANVHYWLTPEQNKLLVKKLTDRALNVIVLGRHKMKEQHASPCYQEYIKELFEGWDIHGTIEKGKHYSIHFGNPNLVEKDVGDLSFFQQFMKSERFLPAFREYIELVLSGRKVSLKDTAYADYLRWRRFKSTRFLLERHKKLILDIRDNGIREPIVIGRIINEQYDENRLKDGDHRLIIAMELGMNKVICKKQQRDGTD